MAIQETANEVVTNSQLHVLDIEGMTCATCAGRIEKVVGKLDGVEAISVNLATEKARVRATGVGLEQIVAAVEKAGFGASKHVLGREATKKAFWWKNPKYQLIIGALLTAPLSVPMVAMLWGQHWMLPGIWQFALALPVQVLIGARFYIAGFKALRAREGNMDLLVALGTSAAFGLSVYNLWFSEEAQVHLYFEASAMVITLIVLGKWLEARAKAEASAAIRSLEKLQPEKAYLVEGKKARAIPVASVMRGDVLLVKPHERVPVDGELVEATAELDESHLTGESLPQAKKVGDPVMAGSRNGERAFRYKATTAQDESSLTQLIDFVEQAQASKAPIQNTVDKVAAVFVPAVLLIAVLTLVGWVVEGASTEEAIIHAVSVLVIACPCALGLATPTALVVASGEAAKRGILIRDAQALEMLHKLNLIAFDKTGTLTKGRPLLNHISVEREWVLSQAVAIAAGLQIQSEHVLAKAVLNYARDNKCPVDSFTQVRSIAGKGIEGFCNGTRYLMGNAALMEDAGLKLPAKVHGNTYQGALSYLMQADAKGGGALIATFEFTDEVKPEARQMVEDLGRLGVRSVMVSGDRNASARFVAEQVGIEDVYAPVLPQDKAEQVKKLQKAGEREARVVGMVGDGVNDAAALATADVGIAMGEGTDIAVHSAGLTLAKGELTLMKEAIEVSMSTWSTIRQNLFWAFVYNVIGIPLAALGVLSPVVAGAAMAMSSVSVVGNSLRLKRHLKRKFLKNSQEFR